MKKFVTLALVGALVLGVSSIVYANVCAFDPVPAATILFPFVTMDYDGDQKTIFSLTNVSAEDQILHVTVWTDFSSAILDFNILLTGYDLISMDISTIFKDGYLPVTKHEGHNTPPLTPELEEGVEPNGPVSAGNTLNGFWVDPGMDFPQPTNSLGDRCDANNSSYPGLYEDPIPGGFLALFKSYLQVSQTANREHSNDPDCTSPYGDPQFVPAPEPFWIMRDETYPTWMYITADVVWSCNKLFPDSPTYFQDQAQTDNVLIGDAMWVSQSEALSETSNAVMIEATEYLDQVATINPDSGYPISFYHRYAVSNDDISDYREPLPTAWAFRYLGAGDPTVNTGIRTWKGSTNFNKTNDLDRLGPDPVSPDDLIASNCHAYTYYAWDEDEMVTTVAGVPWSMPGGESVIPNLIPLETQEIPVEQFDTPGAYGWMLFVWPASNYPDQVPDDFYQTWMGVRYQAYGAWSAAKDGAVLANFNCFSDQELPNLGIDYMYVDGAGYTSSPVYP